MTDKATDTHETPPADQPLALRLSEGLGPTPTLLERLHARRDFMSTDGCRWYMTSTPDSDCQEAAAEIERLRTELLCAREDVKKWQGLADIARTLANLKESRDGRAARLGLGA